jgi:hypothetical protein
MIPSRLWVSCPCEKLIRLTNEINAAERKIRPRTSGVRGCLGFGFGALLVFFFATEGSLSE